MSLCSSAVSSCNGAVNALPSEILSDIFMMALPSIDKMRADVSDMVNGGIKHASISVPMTISHVCRRWRQASLSYGPLWSYLCIKYKYDVNTHPDWYYLVLEIFDTWLHRVDKSPLNFLFHFDLGNYTELDDEFAKRVTAITSRQRQWRDVDFRWCSGNIPSEHPDVRIDDMPLLTSLYLAFNLVRWDDLVYHARVNIANSPAIRHLRLSGEYSSVMDDDDARMKTNSQSTIETNGAGLDDKGRSTTLQLNERCYVPLHHLRQLYLGFCINMRTILDTITAPRLEILCSTACETGYSIYKFMQRSSPPLTMMHLVESVDGETITNILALLPTLKYLRLDGLTEPSRLFRALTIFEDPTTGRVAGTAGRDVICPNMQGFRLGDINVDEGTNILTFVDALLAMVQSRYFILKTFQTIAFGYGPNDILPIPSLDLDRPGLYDEIYINHCYEPIIIKGDGIPPDLLL